MGPVPRPSNVQHMSPGWNREPRRKHGPRRHQDHAASVASKAPLFTDFTSTNLGIPRNLAIPYYKGDKAG